MKIHKKITICLLGVSLILTGCKKLLETKANSNLAVPATAEDLQALLDTYYKMNEQESALGETSADNYFLTTTLWNSIASQDQRNLYIWDKEVLLNNLGNDWYNLYERVNYANAVIEGFEKIKSSEQARARDVLGQALVFRASAFLNGLTIWAKAYDEETAGTDAGIPLRLNTDFNETSVRASVLQGYNQVLFDLKRAIPLLKVTPAHVTRPSKPAAFGLLSRAYLFMRNYNMAGIYADSCLQLKSELLDYNDIDASAILPFSRFNKEVMFEQASGSSTPIFIGNIDSELYATYTEHDLRKIIYFKKEADNTYKYKGSYEAHNSMLFFGIATDEMYLNRAECHARLNNVGDALRDLNTLMIKRIAKDHFLPFNGTDPQVVLQMILLERRKELIFRGLRWPDIKRLNKENPEIILFRNINEIVFELRPNDAKYALPIPTSVIEMTGMSQN